MDSQSWLDVIIGLSSFATIARPAIAQCSDIQHHRFFRPAWFHGVVRDRAAGQTITVCETTGWVSPGRAMVAKPVR